MGETDWGKTGSCSDGWRDPRWWSRRTCTHPLLWELQNYNLAAEQPSTGECWIPPKLSHFHGQRRSPKTVQGVKSCLYSNPILASDARRAQRKSCVHKENPQGLSQTCFCVFECLLQRYVSAMAWHRDRGSECSRPGCGISPFRGGHRSQNLHRTGETDSQRAQTKLYVHQDPGERGSDPTRDWPRLACECPGVSGGGVRWWWPAAGLGAVSVAVQGTFWRSSPLSSLPPPWFGLRSSNREGTQPRPSIENWIKDLLSMALPIRTRPRSEGEPQSVSPMRMLP